MEISVKMKLNIKKHTLLLMITFLLLSCTKEIPLFEPLEEIKIGSKKDIVLKQIEKYKNNGVINNEDTFLLNEVEVGISFLFCANCIDKKLEAIKLKSERVVETVTFLDKYFEKEKLSIDTFKIEKTKGLFNNLKEQGTVIYIYSSKVKYKESNNLFSCKRIETEPCWKYLLN